MNAWSTAGTYDFRGPLDVMSAATVLLDAENTVTGWSRAARDLFGYAPQEIIGRGLDDLLIAPAPAHTPAREPGRTPDDTRTHPPAPAGPTDGSARPARHTGARVARHRDGHTLLVATTVCSLTRDGDGTVRVLVAAELESLRTWDAHQAMLHGLATQSPIGLGIYDTGLRLTWTNVAYEQEIGRPFREYTGKRVDELYGEGRVLSEGYPERLEDVMQQVLDTGEPVFGLLYQARPPSDPEHEHVWACAYYQLLDPHGRVLGVCEDALDITERYRAEKRLELTMRAGVRIGSTLDMIAVAREIADVVVPSFADGVTVDLAQRVLEGEEPGPAAHRVPALLRVVDCPGPSQPTTAAEARTEEARTEETGTAETGTAGAADGGGEDGPRPYPVRYGADTPQGSALASGHPAAVDRHAEPSAPHGEPPDAATGPPYGEPGEWSVLAVPLRARGITMGVVTYFRGHGNSAFDRDEERLAEELATRAALSVDNARRFTRERSAALTLQRNLLPRGLPSRSAVDFAHRYLPADTGLGVGGDWFDVITLSGTRVALVVGDVVGHGVNAAATMGRLRTTVRALARLDLAPDELLTHLDDLVLQDAEESEAAGSGGRTGTSEQATTGGQPGGAGQPDGQPGERHPAPDAGAGAVTGGVEALGVSCLYVVYDPVSRWCTAASAGHAPPALVDPSGRYSLLDLPPGPPLGIGGLPFEAREFRLPEGSLLALFTAGLVEDRERPLDTGLDLLKKTLTRPAGSLEELCDLTMRALQPRGPATEDAALLLARTRALDADHVLSREFPAEPSSVGCARSLALSQLTEWCLDELAFTTELVVSELFTNAVRHASGPVRLRLIRDRVLHCEVWDTGHTSPHLRHAALDDEGGRGLFIVARLVQRWGTRYTSTGKILWTEQSLPRPAPQSRTS